MADCKVVLDALRSCANGECDGCPCADKCEKFIKKALLPDAADAIEELLAERDELLQKTKQLEWVSVEKRLPNLGQKVFTLGARGGLDCGKFIGLIGTDRGNWKNFHWKMYGAKKVRFWMPAEALPKPPKEVSEDA